MPITIRPFEAADRDAFYTAVSIIYGDGMPVAEDREIPAWRSHVVAMDGPACAGVYAELPFNTLRGDASLPTGGIAMVGVVPEKRHTGLGGDLMRYALRDMKSKGNLLASLYPFSESYYRQFGYELCGSRLKISCRTRFLPKLKAELPIRRLAVDELMSVKPCYDTFARQRSGLTDRPEYMWERVFGRSAKAPVPTYEMTVYAMGDPVEAYVILKHDVAFHVDLEIREVGWSSARGYETMLVFMRSMAANKSGLIWEEPSDSPFLNRYMVSMPQTPVALDHLIMFRVLDVPGALRALRGPSCNFTLKVEDTDLPENVGPWRVVSSGGTTVVDPCDSADLTFDIRSFTQAFLGQPSIDDVIRNGQASGSREGVDAFRALMPPTPVYCPDKF